MITGYLTWNETPWNFNFDYIPLGPKVLTLPSGTKQSAGGLVTSKTGKKALGEGLDAMAASMKTEEKGAPKRKPSPKRNRKPNKKMNAPRLCRRILKRYLPESFLIKINSSGL